MNSIAQIKRIGVVTSGGDSQGMNAAIRAVVRTAISAGIDCYAIYEGYSGMIAGGELIRKMEWREVSGILHEGGTAIGSARSSEFRTRHGRRQAAANLVHNGIQGLVVIGGDGSQTGANLFRQEWRDLLSELVAEGNITPDQALAHPELAIVGLVGSIDNDMFGTDMTIGADTALHRIVEAVDAIINTAASHQRSFIVQVMGRHCGYLALMAGLATGANWLFIPENPPEPGWEEEMCAMIHAGRLSGRRHNIILIAEGAINRAGKEISSEYVSNVLLHRLNEEARVTILGHVQRGGSPSAFDRIMPTQIGYTAVHELLNYSSDREPRLIGVRDNRVYASPLMENVLKTRQVQDLIRDREYGQAMQMRGRGFVEAHTILNTLLRAQPRPSGPDTRPLRLAIMHGDAPAPGMNTAVRAAVRLGLDQGHTMLAIYDAIEGFARGDIREMNWTSVHGWVSRGGAELGANPRAAMEKDFPLIAGQIADHRIDGLLMIGGYLGYDFAYQLHSRRAQFPEFNLPILCLPATINNDLPGTELTIGSDTALNSNVEDLDKLKEAALASHRCFAAEVMGRDSGYLALMCGIATGAEYVYFPEEGIQLEKVRRDVLLLRDSFQQGKRVGLIVTSERADAFIKTDFVATMFEKESGGLLNVRHSILGNMQQGGRPSPFDRIQATRLAGRALQYLVEQVYRGVPVVGCLGRIEGKIEYTPLTNLPDLMQPGFQRPRDQPWLENQKIAVTMAEPPIS
ncbi:MAG: 6-phosphofructokinase [Anaerolineae bacterium]|nr:6-phosphofructokinase [Anaerolineae bacterium]